MKFKNNPIDRKGQGIRGLCSIIRLCPIINPVFPLGIVLPKPEGTNPLASFCHFPSIITDFKGEKFPPACLFRSEKMKEYHPYKNYWTKPLLV